MKLDEFMLYAHGSDLCHELELRHAMANCFEALMGALLLDGGIKIADKVFAEALFMESKELKHVNITCGPRSETGLILMSNFSGVDKLSTAPIARTRAAR